MTKEILIILVTIPYRSSILYPCTAASLSVFLTSIIQLLSLVDIYCSLCMYVCQCQVNNKRPAVYYTHRVTFYVDYNPLLKH